MTYIHDFLHHQLGQHELESILAVRARRTTGRETLTFNVSNVTLDFDAQTATVDDELDINISETIDIGTFFEWVTAAERQQDERLWFEECPLDDQGLVQPLMTDADIVVLMCDEGGEVWLHPDEIGTQDPIIPSGPDWVVRDGLHVTPGATRWATADEVAAAWPGYSKTKDS